MGSPLLLSKVKYKASIDDCWSLVSVPFGAKFEDFGATVHPLEVVDCSFTIFTRTS